MDLVVVKFAKISAILALLVLLVSCDTKDNGIITEKTPFFQAGFRIDKQAESSFIERSEAFAKTNNLKMMTSTHHFKENEFSVTLVSPSMNIITDNVAKPGLVWVVAISRTDPSPEERELLSRYRNDLGLKDRIDAQRPPITVPK